MIIDTTNLDSDADYVFPSRGSILQAAQFANSFGGSGAASGKLFGVNLRGDWETAVAYVLDDAVYVAPKWYKCVTAHTASALFATDSAKWAELKGISAADLAATTGANLSGFLPNGATATTIGAFLNSGLLVHPISFGAIGDGDPGRAAANSVAFQAAVNYCIANKKTLHIPRGAGLYCISSPIAISGQLTIIGDGQFNSGFACMGCEAFVIAAGVTYFHLEKVSIGQATRHTTTANTLKAIRINGTAVSRSDGHTYRDIYIDGFETAMLNIWASNHTINNVKSNFGKIGIDVKGDGVNNVVTSCSFSVAGAGSRGLYFSDDVEPTEGWMISENLFYGAEIGIHSLYTNNCHLTDNIIDFCTSVGIKMEGTGGSSTNWTIRGNYIAMDGAAGIAGILLANTTVGSSFRGSVISENDILVYAGSTCTYGIVQSGSVESQNIISKNHVNGMSIYGISVSGGVVDKAIVSENMCPQGFFFAIRTQSTGNVGPILSGDLTVFDSLPFGRKLTGANSIPMAGLWAIGDKCINYSPASGTPKGWVCTAAGTPGTWVSEGNL